ncbi:hypothetical protein [Mucilaginibacter auburnensis]|uniref:Uncharacterized protein n=1 Tax=Mucilaginibacter auburnensis TaxID=1457233 RepID=A0A2H9VQX1_9SPHI|nr:hypothetical protein [Mucilaginibacter auburnensis]PJJ83226.1 hypothetical protein CLV57_0205 [Mucilaginibacter auburnensis]
MAILPLQDGFFISIMNTFAEFKASLDQANPPHNLTAPLKSLWYDGKGDWNRAHAEVDHLNNKAAQRVHAYLHRKEGDIWNADYWYSRTKATRPDIPLDEEWEQLVQQLLNE